MIRPLLAACSLALPLASLQAQVAITTATGVTHLDGLMMRDAAAVEGRARATLGGFRVDGAAATVAHDGLGRGTTMRGDLSYGARYHEWSGRLGPLVRSSSGLGYRPMVLIGGGGEVVRQFQRGRIGIRLEQGIAQVARQRSRWEKQGVTGSYTLGTVDFGFAWQRATVRDSMLRDNVFFSVGDPGTDTLFRQRVRSLQDVSLSAAWGHRDFAVTIEAGRRAGDNVTPQLWWRGGASLDVAPMIALVANVSRTPPDLLLGLRGGRSTMLGMRLNLAGARSPSRRALAALVELRRESPQRVRLIVVLDARERAELIGDATGWKAVPLIRRDDGRWEAWLDAAPGVSRFNVSIDGGPWTTPTGVPSLADEYGGRAFLVDL
jgi:hypothetical protein